MSVSQNRIRYLDGLRGLAILLVVASHYVGPTFAAKLPYGNGLNWLPVLDHGWVGVYLFFLISGYVIFMTLEKCTTAQEFLKRRWLRLFPAMLIVSIAIFTVSHVLGRYMPSGRAEIIDLLPGFSFISDSFWHAGLHREIHSLDSVFWTLYVEAGFYVVIAALYFMIGWQRAILSLIAFWLAITSAPFLIAHLPKTPYSRAIEPFQWAGVMHYGWFAAGALFYKAKEFGSDRIYFLAVTLAMASALTYTTRISPSLEDYMYLMACVFIFSAAQRLNFAQAALESRFALFVGYISYPLYLLHDEIGIGLMGATGTHLPRNALVFLPLPLTGFMVLLAWIVAGYVEPATRDLLKRGLAIPSSLATHRVPSNPADRPS